MVQRTTEEMELDFDIEPEKSIRFWVAGVQFQKEWKENLSALELDEILLLIPEPTNKVDENAVQICSNSGVFLGYAPVKREKNLWILRALKDKVELKATVLECYPDNDPWQALLVRVAPEGMPEL